MPLYLYVCDGQRYETTMPDLTVGAMVEYGTCEQGKGSWILYEQGNMTLELIHLGLAAACVVAFALGLLTGGQR